MKKKIDNSASADFILPRLVDYEGDTSKRWFIIYYVKNTATGKLQRKRYTAINDSDDPKDRWAEAKRAIKDLNNLVIGGYKVHKLNSDVIESEIDLSKASFIEVIEYAIQKKGSKVGSLTLKDYKTLKNTITEFLTSKKAVDYPFKKVDEKFLFSFFDYLKEVRKVGNKTYVNYRTNLHSVFELLINRNLINKNPCSKIEKLKFKKGGSNKPYTTEQIKLIKEEIIKSGDSQLLLFISFIYYCFLRPRTELRLLKIENILSKTLFIPSELSKNGEGEHVVLAPSLIKIIDDYNLRSFPPHFYIFSISGGPGEKPVGKEYFYERHRKILEKLGLQGLKLTTYSYKHTGNINLLESGADIKFIQQHNRHSSVQVTDNYLQNIGMIRNEEVLRNFKDFGEDLKNPINELTKLKSLIAQLGEKELSSQIESKIQEILQKKDF